MDLIIEAVTILQTNLNYFGLLSFCLGAVIASFITCLSYRYKSAVNAEVNALKLELSGNTEESSKGEKVSIYSSRSRCFSCNKKIPIYLNIPILGWLIARGKSSCCKKSIPKAYLFSEIWLATLFLVGTCFLSSTQSLITFWTIAAFTYLAAEIDRLTLTIPFSLTSFISLIYLILTFYFNPYFLEMTIVVLIAGFLFGHLVSLSRFSNVFIGNGDVFFIAFAAAIFLGIGSWEYFLSFIVLASLAFTLKYAGRMGGEHPMGFSLHLSATAVLLHHLYNL